MLHFFFQSKVDPQKTGVSDSDSGIASPMSPSSVCGFLGYADKDKEYCGGDGSWDIEKTEAGEPPPAYKQPQVRIYKF